MAVKDNILDIEEQIIDNFSLFDSWEEKYEYIIDIGKKLPPLEEQHKKKENIIKGCQSTVWLVSDYKEGRVYFQADSDAVIVKGLVSVLMEVLSGQQPEDIINADMKFLDKIGMVQHLAQTRSNGLRSMIMQMKNYALAYKMLQHN